MNTVATVVSPVEIDAITAVKVGRVSVAERTAARLGFTISRTVAIFKALEAQGRGRFVVGRKGYPSRFEWAKAPSKSARHATMLPPPAALPTTPMLPEGMMEYEFPIRDNGSKIRIHAPRDLNADEALHVADIFMTVSDSLRNKFAATVAKIG